MTSYVSGTEIRDRLAAQRAAGLVSTEAELDIIGAALGSPGACEDAHDRLTPAQFGDPVHGRIWSAVLHLARRDMAVTPATVRDRLGLDEGFEEWGGLQRLEALRDISSSFGLRENVDAVVDRAMRRAIRDLSGTVAERATDTSAGDAVELLGELERGAAAIAAGSDTREHWHRPSDMILSALAAAEAGGGRLKHPSGLSELDRITGGLHDGEMTLLGARPGTGKTVGGQAWARTSASRGIGTVFISLEMAEHPMAHRLACDLIFDRNRVAYSGMTTNVTMDRFAQNRLEPWEREAIRKAAATVASWPLLYDVRPGLTIAQIEAITRRAFRKWERQGIAPGLLIIDHLGKVRPSKDRKGSLHAEMADVSGETAEMAKRLGVPVLGLVQLNRQVEARQDKRPILSDLRQAGELEQDARQVIFLHRPEQHLREPVEEETDDEAATRLKKLAEVRNKLWWVVEKNSNGPRGQALTFCEIGCSAVRDWNP